MRKTLKRIILCLCLMTTMNGRAQDFILRQDSLLRVLDREIEHFDQHIARHQAQTRKLTQLLDKAETDSERYRWAYSLFQHYMAYASDSAFFYINQCIHIADRNHDQAAADSCRTMLAIRSSNTGMYQEALTTLGDIDKKRLTGKTLGRYYQAFNHVYSELSYYSHQPEIKKRYEELSRQYATLMLQTMPDDDDASFSQREINLLLAGKHKESMAVNDAWLTQTEPGSKRFALVAFYRFLEYNAQGDSTQTINWLAQSALADVRNAVMDQGSMWELANQLMIRGDVDRSYRYIMFASQCANRYGSRQRSWTIMPLLMDIAQNYKEEKDRTNRHLQLMLGMASLLALLLLVSFFFVYRQRNRLAQAKQELSQSNSDLSHANTLLSEMNGQLSDLNNQLSDTNLQLNESNRVKEEYIGRFLSLCSNYIDKMDALRKRVNKLAKVKNYDELMKLTKTQELRNEELDTLYNDFDSAFLHLFPNFVTDFNQLLREEEQIPVADAGKLNTSIRIFALIRLGIEDSSKIAEFLHYSVNTIYNYRAQVKNKAAGNRDDFENQVKRIGKP